MPTIPSYCDSYLFADDTTLFKETPLKELKSSLNLIEQDIEKLLLWLRSNYLDLNESKTELIVIGSANNLEKCGPVSICVNGVQIKSQPKVRILGFILDQLLSYEDHILNVKRKCFSMISALSMIRPLIKMENMLVLVKAMIFPHIRYMSVVWGSANKEIIKHLDLVIKACARLVMRKKRTDSITNTLKFDLKWLLSDDLCKIATLCCMFNIVKSIDCPLEFKDYFITNSRIHTHNTRNANKLHVGTVNKMSTKRSFRWRGINLWNECEFTTENNLYTFKRKILKHLS